MTTVPYIFYCMIVCAIFALLYDGLKYKDARFLLFFIPPLVGLLYLWGSEIIK